MQEKPSSTKLQRVCQSVRAACLIFAWLFLVTPAKADDNEEANRLIVAALQVWNASQTIQGSEQIAAQRQFDLLDQAVRNLDRILVDYSGSDAAVQLLLGGEFGPLSLDRVQKARIGAAVSVALALANCPLPLECIRHFILSSARNINDDSERKVALGLIALAELDEEILEEALELIDSDQGLGGRQSLLQAFSYALIRSGKLSIAETFSSRISDLAFLGNVYERLVPALLDEARLEDAQRIAYGYIEATSHSDDIFVSIKRHSLLVPIAAYQARRGWPDAFSTLDDLVNRNRGLMEVAIAQAEVGLSNDAINTIAMIQDRRTIVEAYARLSVVEDEPLLLATALNFAYGIEDEFYRERAISDIAIYQAEAQQLQAAMETIESLQSTNPRDSALAKLSAAQASAGLLAEAKETIGRISDYNYAGNSLMELARILAEAGHYTEARVIAGDLRERWERRKAMNSISAAYAKAGKFDEALSIARNNEGYISMSAFIDLVEAMTRQGMLEEAIEAALEPASPRRRVALLLSIREIISD